MIFRSAGDEENWCGSEAQIPITQIGVKGGIGSGVMDGDSNREEEERE